MGDMADWAVEHMMFNEWGEAIPYRRRPPTNVTCRYCDKTGLRWQNVKGGEWRVHEKSGSLHLCRGSSLLRWVRRKKVDIGDGIG